MLLMRGSKESAAANAVKLTDPTTVARTKYSYRVRAFNAAGASGTLIQAEGYEPSHAGTLVYFAVPDIERSLIRVGERGGTTLMPKMSIGEHGYIAHFQDCEGNRIALHSRT